MSDFLLFKEKIMFKSHKIKSNQSPKENEVHMGHQFLHLIIMPLF
jgi:hypothetical protein